MTDPNKTLIILISDRSGSMAAIKDDAEGGINTFIKEQGEQPGVTELYFTEFDVSHDLVFNGEARKFGGYKLHPRGGTALLDAMGFTITQVGEMLAGLEEDIRHGKVYCVISTDGQENSSSEWSHAQIKELVTQQTDQWGWEFVYLGANQDAIQVGASVGIKMNSSMTYDAGNIATAYSTASAALSMSRATGQSVSFTQADRDAVK